jgi:glycosyltransferase involved in cell wall biosynthesis
MKPMIHVHVIDELRTGGAQTHLITMLREAVQHACVQHHVVSLFGDGEMSASIQELGIPLHILDLRPYFLRRRFLAAARPLQKLFEELQPDLVEAHLTWSRLLGLFAAWRAGVPLRVGFEQGDIYMHSWKFRLANFAAQFLSHRTVVCSEALRDWVHRTHGISLAKLLVMHNCVDLNRFQKEGAKAKDIAFPPDTTIFCAAGTLGRGVNKRTDVLLRGLAAARSEGARSALVICGDGEQREELEKLASSLGIAPHVKFLGTRGDIAGVMRACDAFCHAAPFEPFGIVAIEAMAVGLPVLVPNAGGIREVVQHGVTGLLYPALDHEALGKAMVELSGREDLRRSLGFAGHQSVRDRFCVQQYVRSLYRAYGELNHNFARRTDGCFA